MMVTVEDAPMESSKRRRSQLLSPLRASLIIARIPKAIGQTPGTMPWAGR
jgi:hypothetical protein